jgi:hypothetical protein
MFIFTVLSLVVVVIPLVSEQKFMKWVTAILGGLLALMNILDGVTHIAGGEIYNGLYTLLISGGVGIIGTVLAFKWIKQH